jgi:formylglycine-generating enzyme required for sulfatase activity
VAQVVNGFVVSVTVTDGGAGYVEPPVVTLAGGGGTGATATALVTGGAVSQVIVLTAGSGYASAPEVSISAPPVQPAVLDIQMVPLLTIIGSPGDTNRIECANAVGGDDVWIPLTNVVLSEGVYEFYDRISPLGAKRFYRAVLVGAGARPNVPGFVWIPPGRFVMGSPASEQDRYGHEGPQTVVTLTHGFYLCQHEVTQAEYQTVIGSNPSGFQGDPNRPVEQVSWYDATNYCAKLTAAESAAGRLPAGYVYRLPTEAEWEYACRAGATNRFSYGDDPGYTKLGERAWYSANSGGQTHPAGQKLPNGWGLYDVYGNVWEWCWDWYGSYPGGSVTDPRGATSGSVRVFRGGGWDDSPRNCRSAYRAGVEPGYRYGNLGFRVALVAVP